MLVGDALGVPYEFHHRSHIPPTHRIEYTPPAGFKRAHKGIPPGTWSDDGAQALCLLASLLAQGRLDPGDLGERLVRWWTEGYLAVDGRVFDVGIQTTAALHRLSTGTPPLRAGARGERDNGNGSLMRVLPLALWHQGPDAALVRDAHHQSLLTHGHPRALVCCALYCLMARRMLEGASSEEAWGAAAQTLRGLYAAEPVLLAELEERVLPDQLPEGSGYVLDTLHSTRWALRQPDFAQTVRAAISLGEDTDTTACVAGGLAGIRCGRGGIPARWREGLRGRSLLDPLLQALLSARA